MWKAIFILNILFAVASVAVAQSGTQTGVLFSGDTIFQDSVVIAASNKYKDNFGFRKLFLGANYRKEWGTPVTLKQFNIRTEKGGFNIKGIGDIQQTTSLILTDKNGADWALRSVDLNPEKALPQRFRRTLAQGVVQDMISAAHPYAALVVADLAKATGVVTSQPELFFVPNDPALGKYGADIANTVMLLEKQEAVAKDAQSTDKVINEILEGSNYKIDQEKVLNARLLDMLIADWNRNAGQWKWGTNVTGMGKLYYPIPVDRDQAFFNSNGLLLWYLSQNETPYLQGFKKRIRDINGLNYKERDFDRFFMNELDEAAWKRMTTNFQSNLSNEVIESAVSKFPAAIAVLDTQKVAEKLRSRRDILGKDALKYYRFISRIVSVPGSNQSEYYHISKDTLGLHLTVYKKKEETGSNAVMYNRTFDEKVTREVRLYGLNGNDKFEIDDDVSSKIKLRIIGGGGDDTFDLKGKIRSKIYDLSTEKNILVNSEDTKNEFSSQPAVNEYKQVEFKYTRKRFPQLNLGFNGEDGLLVGLGFSYRTFGFRNEPYATDQKLATLYAPNGGAYKIMYNGIFNKIIFKNDLLVNAQFVNPTLNNFFGLGNNTVYDKAKTIKFYRVRYKFIETDVLIRHRFNNVFNFSIGPSYYRYWSNYKDNAKRILGNPAEIGSDSTNIYGTKQFLGGKARIEISDINNEIFPTRGITWLTEFAAMNGFNSNKQTLTKLTSDMTIYASRGDHARLGGVLRFGGGHIFSKQYEYFQALSIGGGDYLRGYRKNRFSGSSIAYANAELRLKLFKSQSYILPGDVGVMGFYDIGRVWQKGEVSEKWHSGYGGGLYYIPYSLVMVSLTAGFSPEDKVFNFTLGTKFRLIF